MSETFEFVLDGRSIPARRGETILEAAERAGVWIPRLCHAPDLPAHGSCRVCTCLVNGRAQAACIQPAEPGMVVESQSDRVTDLRRSIVEMLFAEGNHHCMVCERSGRCELQAVAYRLGITSVRHRYQFPQRPVDASHPEVFLDHNRCILCARCERASRTADGKHVFKVVGRAEHRRLEVDSRRGLAGTELAATDAAVDACPTGALLRKRVGYDEPVGQRPYDLAPIGADAEEVPR